VVLKSDIYAEFGSEPKLIWELKQLLNTEAYREFFYIQNDSVVLRERYQFAVHWILHDVCSAIKKYIPEPIYG